MKKYLFVFSWLTAFSISMGFLESAVVIYLRELYYPAGFSFPLAPITSRIAITEFLREAATIIMLMGVGAMAGKNRTERFAAFLYSFAIWDLFYYVFLKAVLNWPESLFTWDILFLIPVPWVGPVLAPCIVSLSMIFLAAAMVNADSKGAASALRKNEKCGLVLGCLLVLASFLWDYCSHLAATGGAAWKPGTEKDMFAEVAAYVPHWYNWPLFAIGQGIILLVTWRYWITRKKAVQHEFLSV